ncbi:MAG: DNA double-strand break repair nuclease NurA [Anaerolineales bacterium]|nr:DNA double-strand break repair nuclease NurA [Anaerolineales bacterium]
MSGRKIMSLNFQQVYERIREIGAAAGPRQKQLDGLRQRALGLLKYYADKAAELGEKVDRARQADPSLRCAIPLDGRLDASYPAPAFEKPVTLLAADGSQIAPDRHAAVLYSLVNVGALVMELGSGKAPQVFTDSSLLYDDEIYTDTGMLTEEAIEMRRDIAERRKLLELAGQVTHPCVALTDGPVELWGAKDGGAEEYRRNLEIHKSILSQLQAKNVTVAGYVDKPGADLVVRLLEIAVLSSDEEYKEIRKQHSLRGVTDRWLYGSLLKGGHRSSVFGLQSSSRAHYTGDLTLHFFYLNVGDEKHPALVRVEIPKWVADDKEKLDVLHAVLLQQCRIMGAKPYPYILHRAHEVAVVTYEDRKQVEQMLQMELRRAGGEVEEESSKQSAKDLKGRTKR